jgi:hypothetical protein
MAASTLKFDPVLNKLRLDDAAAGGVVVRTDQNNTYDGGTTQSFDVASTTNLTVYGVQTNAGNLWVSYKIGHLGDSDTFMQFEDDQFSMDIGNVGFLTITEDGTQDKVIWGNGGDQDFEIDMGVDDAFKVDGASGNTTIKVLGLTSGTTANEISIDGTLAGDSDNAVPTEKAVKAYVDNNAGGLAGTDLAYTNVMTLTSAAIQGAIDTLSSTYGAGRINLTRGTYVMAAGGINVSNNIEIVGAGWGTILDSTGQQQTDSVIDVDGSEVLLKSFTIQSDPAGGTAFDQISIVPQVSNVVVDLCQLLGSDNDGVSIKHTSTRNVQITRCFIYDPSDDGIDDTSSEYFTYSGNHLESCGDIGIFSGGSTGGTMADNKIFNTVSRHGIRCGAQIAVMNNYIHTCGQYGISCGTNARIIGNMLNDCGRDGVYASGNQIVIQGNTFKVGTSGFYDITVATGNNIAIIGNTSFAAGGEAEGLVHLDNADNCVISGNNSSGHDTCGIQIDSDCDGNIVQGNNLEGEAVAKIVNNQPTQGTSYDTGRNVLNKEIEVTTFTAAAIQTALNSVGDNGKVICVPGTYVFTDTGLTNKYDRVTISGYEAKWDASAGQNTDMWDSSGKNWLTIEGVHFLGAAGGVDTADMVTDNGVAATDVTLRDCLFEDSDDSVLEISAASHRWRISNCIFDNPDADAISANATINYWMIHNNLFLDIGDDTCVFGSAAAVNTFKDNIVITAADQGVYNGTKTLVEGNYFSGCGQESIWVSTDSTIHDNYVVDSGREGILATACKNVSGNTVIDTGNGYANIKILNGVGTVVNDNYSESETGKAEQGIWWDNCTGGTGQGNSFVGVFDTAIWQTDADCDGILVALNDEGQATGSVLNNQATQAESTQAGVTKLSDDSGIQVDATADGMADDSFNGITIGGLNAGENITQWDAVFFNSADSEFHQADASTGSGEFPARGIAVAAGTDGNELIVITKGVVRNDGWAWGTVGGTIYLGESDGALTQTAPSDSGDAVQIMGWAISDDEMMVDVSTTWLVTP